MARRKQRSLQQIMEEQSLAIVRDALPEEWVIHQYAPDYGIDCVVETFEYKDENQTRAETLGEFFLVQVKAQSHVSTISVYIESRTNIEKGIEKDPEKWIESEVVSFDMDVNELHTIMAVGYAVPVVLFLVDLATRDVYFVCLSDYIEKILLFERGMWENSSTVALHIPIDNKLCNEDCMCHLEFLARRSKLFSAFNKFHYQRSELGYGSRPVTVRHFMTIIKRYDIWETKVKWPALEVAKESLNELDLRLQAFDECPGCAAWDELVATSVIPVWNMLCNLSSIYEDVCKEWFLPTLLWLSISKD